MDTLGRDETSKMSEIDEELVALLRDSMHKLPPAPANPVLRDAEFIYNEATDVAIDMQSTKAAALTIHQAMQDKGYSTATWAHHELHPKTKNDDTVAFIFTMDLLNFSFWSDTPFSVEYAGKTWTGYWSLVAALQKSLANDIPITTPSFWRQASTEALESVFAELPMGAQRIACLREVGQLLQDAHQDSIVELVKSAEGSAMRLLTLLTDTFPCFDDRHELDGRHVCLFKRAQIFIADLWACFEGKGIGAFEDIDLITMFADYRLPQMLYTMGCLTFSPPLEAAIRRLQVLPSGSSWELQLRGCSIWCVELLRRAIQQADPTSRVNAILIDFFLYDTVKELVATQGESIPHHRTRSIWY